MSALRSPDFWDDPDILDDFLANQLINRRLAIVIGAGVSFGAGLPSWVELVSRLYGTEESAVLDPRLSPEQASEAFYLKYYRGKDKAFSNLVRSILYTTANLDATSIASDPLLNALGAIMTSSSRGSAACAISFNYDDLLENHLRLRGFVVNSVYELPNWNQEADMTVFHAHGYLPHDENIETSTGIVLTRLDFDRVIGNAEDLWNQKMLDIFRSNTCIFIGLSGEDGRLTNLLSKVNGSHSSSSGNHPFWGVRAVASINDPTNGSWSARGVFCRDLGSNKSIPGWLFNLCRLAAKKRQK